MGRTSVFSCAANFLRGRKCIFCGSFKIIHTSRGYVKYSRCGKSKSLSWLRQEIWILQGFYQLQPAYRLSQDLGVDSKVMESVSAEELMQHIQAKTRKGSVYFTDAFRSYPSLKRYGKHHTINHSKALVSRRTKNHINGIEGVGRYVKHIWYHYLGVSKYHFPIKAVIVWPFRGQTFK